MCCYPGLMFIIDFAVLMNDIWFRHRAVNIFVRSFYELWLQDENIGQEVMIEDLTVGFEIFNNYLRTLYNNKNKKSISIFLRYHSNRLKRRSWRNAIKKRTKEKQIRSIKWSLRFAGVPWPREAVHYKRILFTCPMRIF